MMLIIAYARYCNTLGNVAIGANGSLIGAMDYPMLLAAVFIFAGFAFLTLKCNFTKIASYCFFIYLIHGGLEDFFCKKIIKYYGLEGDCRLIVPLEIIGTFFVSLGLAVIYEKLFQIVTGKIRGK